MNGYRRLRDIPGQAIVEWYEAVGADDDTDLLLTSEVCVRYWMTRKSCPEMWRLSTSKM